MCASKDKVILFFVILFCHAAEKWYGMLLRHAVNSRVVRLRRSPAETRAGIA
jgi:hypothetical protein